MYQPRPHAAMLCLAAGGSGLATDWLRDVDVLGIHVAQRHQYPLVYGLAIQHDATRGSRTHLSEKLVQFMLALCGWIELLFFSHTKYSLLKKIEMQ
jgi:hypothetical protein